MTSQATKTTPTTAISFAGEKEKKRLRHVGAA
jgi:hypothetical protein